ncbi:MAG: hypothetical protein Q8N95_06455 [Desulfobacterales bacterium]|nr:hypothetical protein [Desulfobacterales bacterium]
MTFYETVNDVAPRLHNLVRLAELSGIIFEQKQIDLLAEMNPFNIEGRYPEVWGATPSRKEADMLSRWNKITVPFKGQERHKEP